MKLPILILCIFLLPIPSALAESNFVDDDGNELCRPNTVDIVFVIDTTGSMAGVIANAKSTASNIMANVEAEWPGTAFGVGHYEDYPPVQGNPNNPTGYGDPSDQPWYLDHTISTNSASVDASIQAIGQGSGWDTPESLVRALYEVGQPGMGWRGGLQLVVLFTDAPGHDTNFGGYNTGDDPGPDGLLNTGDELDFETQVAMLQSQGIQVLAVQNGGNAMATDYLAYIAAQTNGLHTNLNSASPAQFEAFMTDHILSFIKQDAIAEAYDLYVGLKEPNTPASVLVDRLNLQQAPDDSGQSMVRSSHLIQVAGVGDFHIDLDVLNATAQTDEPLDSSHAQAHAHIERFVLTDATNGIELLRAEALTADAVAVADPSGAYAAARASSALVRGSLVGTLVDEDQTTHIGLINGGSLIINEKNSYGTGTEAWSEANAIHLYLPVVAGTTLEIIVSHAMAGAACLEEASWTPDPPTDDPIVPDCILNPSAETTAAGLPVVGTALDALLKAWDGAEIHLCLCPTNIDLVQALANNVIGGVAFPKSPDACRPCEPIGTDKLPLVERGLSASAATPGPGKIDCTPCDTRLPPGVIAKDLTTTESKVLPEIDGVPTDCVECPDRLAVNTAILSDPCQPCIDPSGAALKIDDVQTCIVCPIGQNLNDLGLADPCNTCIDTSGTTLSTQDVLDCVVCPVGQVLAYLGLPDPCNACVEPQDILSGAADLNDCATCPAFSEVYGLLGTYTGFFVDPCNPCDIPAGEDHYGPVVGNSATVVANPCAPCVNGKWIIFDTINVGAVYGGGVYGCACPPPTPLSTAGILNWLAGGNGCGPVCDGGTYHSADVGGQAGTDASGKGCRPCPQDWEAYGYVLSYNFAFALGNPCLI